MNSLQGLESGDRNAGDGLQTEASEADCFAIGQQKMKLGDLVKMTHQGLVFLMIKYCREELHRERKVLSFSLSKMRSA